jgi:3-hydroxy-9,10-secoandrosta-1,3,5(10)-triene-9,17-dione monooxygenase reductase component
MIDPVSFRSVLAHYPTGVCVVTALGLGDEPIGMSVGSFTSVSLDPPLVAFFPDRRSATWQQMRETGRFCVNVLGAHQEPISRRFAVSATDKFAGLVHRVSTLGLPIIDGVVAWIDCRLDAVHEAGDHFIVIGEVAALGTGEEVTDPLLFHRGGYGQVHRTVAAV